MSGFRQRLSRLLATTAFVVAAAVGFTAFGAIVTVAPASAESSSTLTAQYPWPHNGCSVVTDNPTAASFTYPCNHHDGCYGGRWADRATCDQWFLNDMMNACRRLPYVMIGGCVAVAYVYYGAVRVLGQGFYDSNSQLARISTPMRLG